MLTSAFPADAEPRALAQRSDAGKRAAVKFQRQTVAAVKTSQLRSAVFLGLASHFTAEVNGWWLRSRANRLFV